MSEADYSRLSALARAIKKSLAPERAAPLEEQLRDAILFEEGEIGPNYVAMRSLVTIRDVASGEVFSYRLVFPAEASIEEGRISVLSPLGAALLGRREGESFSYRSPGGLMAVRVDRVGDEA
ncbi:MAG TPA: GreA/GreB family elongation factor [Spirochaetales bacterium]|nr:GreA/GreB family elongation factor [Spirochaetales bacterium]HRY56123.1 GreA/GreB family elongation factor [Spirochaetia bacterium]HRZ65738.1 GreA/GreB family elongation factor [Spirochaetia bacterium]